MKIDNALLDELYKETKRVQREEMRDCQRWSYYQAQIDLIETLQSLDNDIDLSNNQDSLKQYALSIIDDLEEDGYDLTEGSWLLQWKYDERPDIPITLIVGEFTEIETSNPEDLQ